MIRIGLMMFVGTVLMFLYGVASMARGAIGAARDTVTIVSTVTEPIHEPVTRRLHYYNTVGHETADKTAQAYKVLFGKGVVIDAEFEETS